nr:leucyl aminopeptidase [Actinomyces slackii]
MELSQSVPTTSDDAPAPQTLVLAAVPDGEARGVELLVEGAAETGVDTRALAALLPDLGFKAEQDAVARVPAGAVSDAEYCGPPVLVVVGLGKAWAAADPTKAGTVDDEAALGADRPGLLRRAAGRAARALAGTTWAAMALPTPSDSELRSVIEGAALGAYSWSGRSTGPDQGSSQADTEALERITVVSPLADAGQEALAGARALARATALARDLVNEPPNRLTPPVFAERAEELAAQAGLDVTVWDDEALAEQGCGGIIGVGQGSVNGPRLVRLEWAPEDPAAHVALVGKGITFDSGGLSLKPAASMPEMKSDMAGAAAVLGTVMAAAQLELGVRVTAWLALAENMPSGGAQRPSDIVTMRSGTTVEITNTDAEGRLVMADALATAVAEEPDAVVDVATLTGAQLIALGERVAGVMGTPMLREELVAAAQRSGEALWPMPLPASLREGLDSPFADLRNANMSSRFGGMLSAGLFLREFVGRTPWAHLDVAGPAYNDKAPWGLTPTGGTGMGVATLVEWLRSQAQPH